MYHKHTQELWQNRHIITTFWHRPKVYFMCIKPLWWLFTVPIMNKIHWFISNISLQTYKMYVIDINPTFWHKPKVYFTRIKSLLWLIAVPIKFMTTNAIITCIWHGTKCYFTLTICTWLLYQPWIKYTYSRRYHNNYTKYMKKWP